MSDEREDPALTFLRAGGKVGAVTPELAREAAQLDALLSRPWSFAGRAAAGPARVRVDLGPLARMAGMPLADVLATPDETRAASRDNPARAALSGSRTPARFADAVAAGAVKLEGYKPTQDAAAWLAGDGWALVMGGATGTGKTLAACWALAQLGGGLFLAAPDLVDRDVGPVRLGEARQARVLVLDDLGAEGNWPEGIARIARMLEERHAGNLRTLVTTNLQRIDSTDDGCAAVPGFASRYGARLNGRVDEGGRFVVYGGPSRRTRGPVAP